MLGVASPWLRGVRDCGSGDYAEMWVWFSEEGLPGPRERPLGTTIAAGQEPEFFQSVVMFRMRYSGRAVEKGISRRATR